MSYREMNEAVDQTPPPPDSQELKEPKGIMKNFSFPLLGGEVATIQVPYPITQGSLDLLKKFLAVYGDALTGKAEEPSTEDFNS